LVEINELYENINYTYFFLFLTYGRHLKWQGERRAARSQRLTIIMHWNRTLHCAI